jgi:hypothetical protein
VGHWEDTAQAAEMEEYDEKKVGERWTQIHKANEYAKDESRVALYLPVSLEHQSVLTATQVRSPLLHFDLK